MLPTFVYNDSKLCDKPTGMPTPEQVMMYLCHGLIPKDLDAMMRFLLTFLVKGGKTSKSLILSCMHILLLTYFKNSADADKVFLRKRRWEGNIETAIIKLKRGDPHWYTCATRMVSTEPETLEPLTHIYIKLELDLVSGSTAYYMFFTGSGERTVGFRSQGLFATLSWYEKFLCHHISYITSTKESINSKDSLDRVIPAHREEAFDFLLRYGFLEKETVRWYLLYANAGEYD
jgi:hypothetical protein